MSVELSEEQKSLINKIAGNKKFHDFEVTTASISGKGDNYLGEITRVTVKNHDGKKLELILKSASPNEALRKMTPVHEAYQRESHIYENVFEEFKKFQSEYNIPDPFSGHPAFYGSSLEEGSEWLLMENITDRGYSMWNRKKPMTAEYITAVFIEYAKFHAVCLAMQQKKPDLYKELTKKHQHNIFKNDYANNDDKARIMHSIFENGYKALEDQPEMVAILKKIEDSLMEHINEEENEDFKVVINHGDNWCNNLMFESEKEGTKSLPKVCILDWQLSKKGSPAEDLSYFFLAHSPKEILYDYTKYLKLYHDTLSRNLKDFGCDAEEIFPYSLLEIHWRIFIYTGFIICLPVLKMMYCDSDEALDFAEIAEAGEDLHKTLNRGFRNPEEYNQRIKEIIQFLDDSGLTEFDFSIVYPQK